MDTCECGVQLRMFWVWRDANDVLHASSFRPSSGAVRAFYASTARDALLPLTGERMPKHQVRDAYDPTLVWEGRCTASITAAAG